MMKAYLLTFLMAWLLDLELERGNRWWKESDLMERKGENRKERGVVDIGRIGISLSSGRIGIWRSSEFMSKWMKAWLEQIGHSAINRQTREESTYPKASPYEAKIGNFLKGNPSYFTWVWAFYRLTFLSSRACRSSNRVGDRSFCI